MTVVLKLSSADQQRALYDQSVSRKMENVYNLNNFFAISQFILSDHFKNTNFAPTVYYVYYVALYYVPLTKELKTYFTWIFPTGYGAT